MSCVRRSNGPRAHPAQVERVTEFNKRIGLDVKHLQGWKANRKIPAVNIVDYASSFQIMVPLQAPKESAELIRKALCEHWIAWAGRPSEIVVDPARANLSEAFTTCQEMNGSTICATAAEAHWQLGKVEVRGGWFNWVVDEPLEIVPATASLYEEQVAKSVAIRQVARKAVLEMLDDKALRLSQRQAQETPNTSAPVPGGLLENSKES